MIALISHENAFTLISIRITGGSKVIGYKE